MGLTLTIKILQWHHFAFNVKNMRLVFSIVITDNFDHIYLITRLSSSTLIVANLGRH